MNDENGNSSLSNIQSITPSVEEREENTQGKRVRKSVQFLNQEYDSFLIGKKTIETESGIGVKISDMEKCVDGLSHVTVGKCPLLKPLHNLMFRRAGKEREIKANIMNFNGFSYLKKYEKDDAMLTKERANVEFRVNNQSVDGIKTMMDILGIDRSSTSFEDGKVDKTKLIDRFVDFLEKPDRSFLIRGVNKLVPKNKAAKAKITSSKKKLMANSSDKITDEVTEREKKVKEKTEKPKASNSKVSKAKTKVKARKVKKAAFGSASANMLTKSKTPKDKVPPKSNGKIKRKTDKQEELVETKEIEEKTSSNTEDNEAEEDMVMEENNQEDGTFLDYESIDFKRLQNDVQGIIDSLKDRDEDITMRLIYSGLGKIYRKSEDEIKTRKMEIKNIVAEQI